MASGSAEKAVNVARSKNEGNDSLKKGETLAIFFDGGCRVCAWEVEKYLKADLKGNLTTIDINSADFKAEVFGLDPVQVRKTFHVLTPSGSIVEGVDAFLEIWKALDRPLSRAAFRVAKIPAVHGLLRIGYSVFVEIRPYLPRKTATPECGNGQCETRYSR